MRRNRASTVLAFAALLAAAGEARADVHLSPNDRHNSIELSADLLSARFNAFNGIRGVRSDVAIQPGSGFFYFEGSRTEAANDFSFGVATAAELLTNAAGTTVQSAGANMAGGPLRYGSGQNGQLAGTYDTFGFAVDYRGFNPVVHLLASNTLAGDALYIGTVTMSQVTGPIYIFVSGRPVSTGFRQHINGGNDLVARPFRYSAANVAAVLDARFYRGSEGLVMGWPTTPNANRAGTVSIAGGARTIVLGSEVSLSATATDPEDGDRTGSLVWSDQQSAATGNGGSFVFTPSTLGRHTIIAQANDSRGVVFQSTVIVTVVLSDAVDADGDDLSQSAELAAGSSPAAIDTDQDGLADNVELNTHQSDPSDSDSDDDGIADAYEITHALAINNAADAALDLDGDSHTNLAEYLSGTSASSNVSYPNRGVVRLNENDRDPTITLSPDRLGVAFAGPGARGVRSEVSIAPNSGWYYLEGRREITALGNYGFGVASASAPLDAGGGSNDQSIGVDTLGRIFYNGAQVATFADTTLNTHYGVVINYSGANPIVYVVTECTPVRLSSFNTPDGYACSNPPGPIGTAGGSSLPLRVSAPITMSNVSGPLFALVYGEPVSAGFIATLNGGGQRFNYPANFVLFNEGITGAEFMGTGFGPENTYAGRATVPQHSRVFFQQGPLASVNWRSASDPTIRLSPDGLGASYVTGQKGAIRANQGMIGEFRYWEAHREIAPANFGQGMMTEFTQTNPYCFAPEQPSMSLNSAGGMWRNLVPRAGENFNTSANSYYGFAVDYRGARPIVRTIVGGTIISTMSLDVFTPLYPTIYGNPQGARLVNTANFGTRPFFYDARTILQNAGVDVSQFVLGWGAHTSPDPAPTTRPEVIAQSISSDAIDLTESLTITASALDAEDGNITAAITWTIDGAATAVTGSSFTFTPTPIQGGFHVIRATITDSAGATDTTAVVVEVINDDDDSDGLEASEELARGTNTLDPDSDDDGLLDGHEVYVHLSNPLAADTDADGMGDAFEVANGLAINSDDAGADQDNDGYGNLEEMVAGSNPLNALSFPVRRTAVLSATDRHVNSLLTVDQLGFGGGNVGASTQRAARSDLALAPGGFYYYEGRREVTAQNFGFGVATAAAALDTFAGSTNQSAGMNALGFVAYNGMQLGTFTPANTDTYGIAVDYRGANPIAHMIISTSPGGPGVLIRSVTMTGVTAPVYMFVFGYRTGPAIIQQTVNTGADLIQWPFRFDARAILAAAGVSNVSAMSPGWSERINRVPSAAIAQPAPATTLFQEAVLFQASATDADEGDLSAAITWSDNGVIVGSGASYNFPANVIGSHLIRARVVDAAGAVAISTHTINVLDTGDLDEDNDGLVNSQELANSTDPNDADSDDDGLLDGDEVLTHGTDPNSADTDGDLIDDAYELAHQLDPSFADANDDDDSDGYSNLEEYLGSTDPQDMFVYPGPARVTRLNELDKHSAVTLSADRMSITIAAGQGFQHRGVKSDMSVGSGDGFVYYEGRRLAGLADYSFGVGTSLAALDQFVGRTNQSAGINVGGLIVYNNAILSNFTAANADTYGFAVDYRGATPIVYVIASTTTGGPGVLLRTINMTAVTTPLYMFLSGVRSSPNPQQGINAGDNLGLLPFRYDVVGILTAAGVPGANVVQLGWTVL